MRVIEVPTAEFNRRAKGHAKGVGAARWLLAGCLLSAMLAEAAALRLGPSPGQERPLPTNAEYTLRVYPRPESRDSFDAPKAGPAALLLRGLTHGGTVDIGVNGLAPASVELLASGGLAAGRADCALVTAPLLAGRNEIRVTESDGVQVVRVPGTNQWFATSTASRGAPLFSVDLDAMFLPMNEYCVNVYYGPRGEPFLWFSGRWDIYFGEVYGDRLTMAGGSSAAETATLWYTVEDSRRNLAMQTRLSATPDPVTGACTLRVRQTLRAVGEPPPSAAPNLQFLHVKIDDDGASDWDDGVPDYSWYRTPPEGSPDALPGSRTGMARMDDNSLRIYEFPVASSAGPKTALSSTHHTGAFTSLGSSNAIGGFLTKTGVGSCGWVFHRYQATFADGIAPIFSHCGDGADTHFYVHAGDLLYGPLRLRKGDRIDAEYSLVMLPSEVLREDIEDLNEADLLIFGEGRDMVAPVARWVGTKSAVGLLRADGSLILRGLGRKPSVFALPESTRAQVRRAYGVYDLANPDCEMLEIERGQIVVRPGWFTVVDCGAALLKPHEANVACVPRLRQGAWIGPAPEPAVIPSILAPTPNPTQQATSGDPAVAPADW